MPPNDDNFCSDFRTCFYLQLFVTEQFISFRHNFYSLLTCRVFHLIDVLDIAHWQIGPAVRADFRRLYPANAKTPTCCPSDDNRTKVTNSVTSARSLWWHVGPYFWPADLTRTANPIGSQHSLPSMLSVPQLLLALTLLQMYAAYELDFLSRQLYNPYQSEVEDTDPKQRLTKRSSRHRRQEDYVDCEATCRACELGMHRADWRKCRRECAEQHGPIYHLCKFLRPDLGIEGSPDCEAACGSCERGMREVDWSECRSQCAAQHGPIYHFCLYMRPKHGRE